MRALIRELIETVILALLIFLVLQSSVQHFRVEGASMQPTLEEDQYLLVNKLVYFRLDAQTLATVVPFVNIQRDGPLFAFHPPRQGEIVIFRFPRDPSQDFVKRVIGVGGDTIEIRRGTVFVDGDRLDEPYITGPGRRTIEPLVVPEGSFYVLGDNRRASSDSRDWGPVQAENMIGRAFVAYWPLERLRTLMAFGWP